MCFLFVFSRTTLLSSRAVGLPLEVRYVCQETRKCMLQVELSETEQILACNQFLQTTLKENEEVDTTVVLFLLCGQPC